MRKILLPALAVFAFATTQGQGSQRLYSVTGVEPGSLQWNNIRQVAGGSEENALLLDAAKPANFIQQRGAVKAAPQLSNGSADLTPGLAGIAALAYDVAHHRLYFAPMFREGGIRYIELGQNAKGGQVYTLDNKYNLVDRAKDGEGKNITRMAIAKGGVGYAISNDGNSFIRFSTGKDAAVENLGMLIDDSKNGSVSVHNACSGWGGDIVAAYTGELYLFTLRQQVFKIDPATRITTYMGSLKNAPADFTVNGAAVDAKGNVVFSSAVMANKQLVMPDINTLETKMTDVPGRFNASDLASSNLLFTPATDAMAAQLPAVKTFNDDRSIGVYPNPVTTNQLLVTFNKVKAGRYQVDMVSGAGAISQSHRVYVQQNGQTLTLRTNNMSRGFYVLRVTGGSGEVFSEKVLLK